VGEVFEIVRNCSGSWRKWHGPLGLTWRQWRCCRTSRLTIRTARIMQEWEPSFFYLSTRTQVPQGDIRASKLRLQQCNIPLLILGQCLLEPATPTCIAKHIGLTVHIEGSKSMRGWGLGIWIRAVVKEEPHCITCILTLLIDFGISISVRGRWKVQDNPPKIEVVFC
jgi:hypothetical protein